MTVNVRGPVVALLAAALSACAVGPNFHSPTPPATDHYTRTPQPTATVSAPGPAGTAQSFGADRDIPADWWTLFHSKELDELMRQALTDSPTVQAAQATLTTAAETYRSQRGALLLPKVDAQASAQRQKEPGAVIGAPQIQSLIFNVFDASLNVSYRFDLFGASRRQLEGLRAQTEYERWELDAAELTLADNVVTTAVNIASLHAQIAALTDIVASEREQLKVVQRQFDAGGASRSDVLAQQTQVAQNEAQLPALEKQLAQAAAPACGARRPHAGRRADARFHARSADAAGRAAAQRAREARAPASRCAGGRSAAAPVDRAARGRDRQHVPAAEPHRLDRIGDDLGERSVRDRARRPGTSAARCCSRCSTAASSATPNARHAPTSTAPPRRTARRCCRRCRTSPTRLKALEADARTLQAETVTETDAQDTLNMTRLQYKAGGVSYLTLLNAERTYLEARESRVQAEAARFADTAALFQALGGGWWNRDNGRRVASEAPLEATLDHCGRGGGRADRGNCRHQDHPDHEADIAQAKRNAAPAADGHRHDGGVLRLAAGDHRGRQRARGARRGHHH